MRSDQRPRRGLAPDGQPAGSREVTLFLCGDVMTGRGIDQVLPHRSDPRLFEPYVGSAVDYVELAERKSGPIRSPVEYSYIWGDALPELDRIGPDARIINLETSVTTSDRPRPGKGIHYRMHPDNLPCISAAGVDCCTLANNHVMDWGVTGLRETLEVVEAAGIQTAGAGLDAHDAATPAIVQTEAGSRVIVISCGTTTSGIPEDWAARDDRPGVNLLEDLSRGTVREIGRRIGEVKSAGDVAVVSIHWGSNWGYRVPDRQREFAHRLIGEAGVDVVHGHSSHHFKGIEVYRGRPILYGSGDFLNDYEGIAGKEEYRAELTLMYFPTLDASTGRLSRFLATPMRIERFRLNRASEEEVDWVREILSRESEPFGAWAEPSPEGALSIGWNRGSA